MGNIFWIILVGTPLIGVLIVVHEFGHFLIAKLCGVGVVKFAVGFGPAIARFRRNETIYQIGLIPLGGFVRMVGDIPDMLTGSEETDEAVRAEDDEAEEDPQLAALLQDRSKWFIEKGLLARSAIVAAGPIFNFLLAIVVVAFSAFVYGQQEYIDSPRIGEVGKGSPAQKAGLQKDDLIVKIQNKSVISWDELAKNIHNSGGDPLELTIKRGNERLGITVIPQKQELPDLSTGGRKEVYLVGITPSTQKHDLNLFECTYFGMLWTLDKTALTYIGLWGLVSGKASPQDLAGPLFIFEAAGKEAEKGFMNLLYFMALLSVSLAVLNLLPIPILDGGHLLFFLIEALVGPVSIRSREFAQQVGMVLLISLMLFAIYNDISRDPDALNGEFRWEQTSEEAAE